MQPPPGVLLPRLGGILPLLLHRVLHVLHGDRLHHGRSPLRRSHTQLGVPQGAPSVSTTVPRGAVKMCFPTPQTFTHPQRLATVSELGWGPDFLGKTTTGGHGLLAAHTRHSSPTRRRWPGGPLEATVGAFAGSAVVAAALAGPHGPLPEGRRPARSWFRTKAPAPGRCAGPPGQGGGGWAGEQGRLGRCTLHRLAPAPLLAPAKGYPVLQAHHVEACAKPYPPGVAHQVEGPQGLRADPLPQGARGTARHRLTVPGAPFDGIFPPLPPTWRPRPGLPPVILWLKTCSHF